MSDEEEVIYACKECLATGIETTEFRQDANVYVSYGGEVIKGEDGLPEWQDDELGGEVVWDITEVEGFTCCGDAGHHSLELEGLAVEVRRTELDTLELVSESLGL